MKSTSSIIYNIYIYIYNYIYIYIYICTLITFLSSERSFKVDSKKLCCRLLSRAPADSPWHVACIPRQAYSSRPHFFLRRRLTAAEGVLLTADDGLGAPSLDSSGGRAPTARAPAAKSGASAAMSATMSR